MIRSVLVMLSLALTTGCSRKTASPPSPASSAPDQTDASHEAEEPEPLPPPETSAPPAEPGTCAEGGRLWDGKLGDCSYEHGGCCYDSAASACAAAGCASDRCNVMESYPAQIACSEG